jgi:E3 ubiquitin-protein ligase BRE1
LRARKTGNTAEAVAELELELQAVRKTLKCGVCSERDKNVVITKCWHMFCKHCVDRMVESRNRKCPGCGIKFTSNDVKEIYIT